MTGEDPTAAFRVEAAELLDQVEQGLLDLAQRLDDTALVNAIFRGLHTLKGSGAMFGFDALASFTHHCESAFDRVRKGDALATPELVSIVLSARDHMARLIDGGASAAEGDEILSRLATVIGAAQGVAATASSGAETAVPTEGQSGAGAGWTLSFRLPPDAMANGTNPLSLLDELRELGECTVAARTDAIPPLDDLVPSECHFAWDVALKGDIAREQVEDVFLFVMDDMELSLKPMDADGGAREPAQAPVPATIAQPSGAVSPVPATREVAGRESDAPVPAAAKPQGENVRIPAERLDELMDRVGELVIAQSRLTQIAGNRDDLVLRSVSEEIERLAGELRDTTMALRMVPVASLFGRFRRLVHDLARDTGKAIVLETGGESTEIDKTVIERLFDPLVHVIRNSCDHGLEPPAERRAAGKSEAGTVRLHAQQAGGEVLIEVRDDGRGVDRERVRAKAEASGLIQPDQAIGDQELLGLIFHPGFSTAAQVTNLSGRGVGMDVVKRTIESLRGAIDIASVPGEGSTLTLRIPLTLAIIDGLLVRVGEGYYVLPLAAVEECLELSLEDDMRSRQRNIITLRDQLIPFLRLRELFDTGTRPDPHQKIVVVRAGEEQVGLVVDQIVGNHQTVIKALPTFHREIETFSGTTILGDGNVAMILDVANLVDRGQPDEEMLRAAG